VSIDACPDPASPHFSVLAASDRAFVLRMNDDPATASVRARGGRLLFPVTLRPAAAVGLVGRSVVTLSRPDGRRRRVLVVHGAGRIVRRVVRLPGGVLGTLAVHGETVALASRHDIWLLRLPGGRLHRVLHSARRLVAFDLGERRLVYVQNTAAGGSISQLAVSA
jgi:hypothetical protein